MNEVMNQPLLLCGVNTYSYITYPVRGAMRSAMRTSNKKAVRKSLRYFQLLHKKTKTLHIKSTW